MLAFKQLLIEYVNANKDNTYVNKVIDLADHIIIVKDNSPANESDLVITVGELIDLMNLSISGVDGKTAEFYSDSQYLKWRYVGDTEWINLFDISKLVDAEEYSDKAEGHENSTSILYGQTLNLYNLVVDIYNELVVINTNVNNKYQDIIDYEALIKSYKDLALSYKNQSESFSIVSKQAKDEAELLLIEIANKEAQFNSNITTSETNKDLSESYKDGAKGYYESTVLKYNDTVTLRDETQTLKDNVDLTSASISDIKVEIDQAKVEVEEDKALSYQFKTLTEQYKNIAEEKAAETQAQLIQSYSKVINILNKTSSFVLDSQEYSSYIRCTSSSDIDINIPDNALNNYPVNAIVSFRKCGTGDINLVAESGVTLYGNPNLTEQYRIITIIYLGNNEWDIEN